VLLHIFVGHVREVFILPWFDISFANTLLITLAKLIVKLSVLCEIRKSKQLLCGDVEVFICGGVMK
jgi:hypothetical protein